MPIVGEAIIRVKVISDRLADDIRSAVKKGVADAGPDIDRQGEDTGNRFGTGVANGVRKSRDKVSKEVELSARRFTAGANGVIDDEGNRLGRRFTNAISSGVRSEEGRVGNEIQRSMARAFGSGGNGASDSGGFDAGRRFTRAIGAGVSDAAPDFTDDVRRVFHMRPGDIDADEAGANEGRRFGDGVRNGFTDRLRNLGNVGDKFANDFAASAGRGFRRARNTMRSEFNEMGKIGDQTRERLRSTFGRIGDDSRDITDGFRIGMREGFRRIGEVGREGMTDLRGGLRRGSRDVDEEGNRIGQSASNSVGRGFRRNQTKLGTLFSGIGKSLGSHFNLGIGASKMGAAVISILATAGPSLLAGAAAIGTAMATEIITALGAIGPGLGGAIGIGLAGASSLLLNFGLLFAAFKSGAPGVKELGESFKALGKEIGTPIAQGMLPGFADAVNGLRSALPQLNDILTETGQAFGTMAKRIAETITSAENMGRIKGILATNKTFVDNFGIGLSGLTESFLILFNASKPFIDYVGEIIAQFGQWASASLAASEANGNLAAWMDRMLANFKQLAGTVVDFGKGIGGIFSAASGSSEGLMNNLQGIAERFKDWTSDDANMAKMTTFFEKARTLASKVYDVLGSIFTAGGNAFAGMDLGPILHVLDTLQTVVGPAIARFFNQIQAGGSANLVAAFDNIGAALTKIADSGTFQKVAEIISAIILKITELANTDFGATILSWVLPIALMGGIVTSLLGPLFSLGSAMLSLSLSAGAAGTTLGALAAPLAVIVGVAAAVAGAFALMWANSESFRNAVSGLATTVGGALMDVWDKLSPKLTEIWGKLQELAGVIGDRLAPIIEFIGPIIARVFTFIGDVIGNAIDAFSGFIDVLIGIFTGDWGRIWDGVKQIFSAAWNQILTVFGGVVDAIGIAWDTIVAVFTGVGGTLLDIVSLIWEGISNVFHTVVDAIGSWFADRWENIVNVFMGVWNNVTSFIGTVFSGIWNIIKGGLGFIIDGILAFGNLLLQIFLIPFRAIWLYLQWLWSLVGDWLTSKWNDIVVSAQGIWNGLTAFFSWIWDGISTVFHAVVDPLVSWLGDRWQWISDTATTIWNGITAFFSMIWEGIKVVFTAAADAVGNYLAERWALISGVISTVWSGISAFFSMIWDGISAVFHTVVDAVSSWLADRWENIKNVASTAWNAITGVASTAWNAVVGAIEGVIEPVVGWLQEKWDDITSAVSTAFNAVAAPVKAAWDAVYDNIIDPVIKAFNGVTEWVGKIVGAVQGALDFIGRLASAVLAAPDPNNLVGSGQGVAFGGTARLDLIPHIGKIPALAMGGIVPAQAGGGLYRLGEAGRRERVEPLDAQGLSVRDKAMIKTLAESFMGSGGDTSIYIGNELLTTVVDRRLAAHDSSLARRASRSRSFR